ncbi:hypothetical protein M378DRAFT_161275 [Amanita muscaria Koide BX008]|uniref:Uncharacterized protein n=1 Tax=Amanita muscaria (strain Koide BX008) TaxID=946122 RepID=A0A0C2XB48_AMAMK|nr:hypothetical protein M378DRAFT_161275 [Amanita muscaria Koide BX008]
MNEQYRAVDALQYATALTVPLPKLAPVLPRYSRTPALRFRRSSGTVIFGKEQPFTM